MSNRKKFSKEEIKNVGLRIKASRVLTGLNQEEFGTKHNIPVPSIKTWEFGSVVPRLDGLTKFADALRESGVHVSNDWLLYGIGTGPSYFLGHTDDTDGSVSDEILAFKELFKKECKKNKENPVFFEICDDEMVPMFKPGDLVAGVLKDKTNLKDNSYNPMLVNMGNDNYVIRYLHVVEDEYFICSIKTPTIKKVSLESFGYIRWYRIN